MNRRRLLMGAAALALPSLARADAPVAATDLLGRRVELARPARRIVLAQGRHLGALALIHPDPVGLLAGIGGDLKRQDAETAARFTAAFPALAGVATVGTGAAAGFSAEQAIACGPDLVVFSRSLAAGIPEAFPLLAAAGIATAVVDFHERPMRDTLPSLAILGALLGRAEAAAAYAGFCETRLAAIRARTAGADRPGVFLHAHAGGSDCCFTAGRGTYTDFIDAAGGVNLAANLLPGVSGQVAPEMLVKLDPAVYVATGGTHLRGRGGLILGSGVAAAEARASFDAVLAAVPVAGLAAVQAGRAHGLWQSFADNPVHIVAIEALARWLHPERLAGIDPAATLAEINRRFLALPMAGTYWIDQG